MAAAAQREESLPSSREPGLDHFYRDPEINLKSLAIANLVADELKGGSALQK